MIKSVRDMLVAEAAEAEALAEAEDRGDSPGQPAQRARRQAPEPSQVYSVRIPVDRLEQLRRLAETRDVAPTALVRQFVLEALDREAALDGLRQAHIDFAFSSDSEVSTGRENLLEVKLGPRRQRAQAPVRRVGPVAVDVRQARA